MTAGHRTLPPRVRSPAAILVFFLLAFVWSWTLGYAAAQTKSAWPVCSVALTMASGFGPSLAALTVVAALSKGTGLREWLAQSLNWRVGWRWFAFAFLAPPTVMLLALAMNLLLGGHVREPMPAEHIPLAIANFGFVLLVGGPLGEEFGWRGYAMTALTATMNWRVASLIVGVVWSLWHAPLFFLAGTAQSSTSMPIFMINMLAGSFVFGWLFERTQSSVLPVLVLHTSLNSWAGILMIMPTTDSGQPFTLVTGLLVSIAVVLLIIPSFQNHRRAGDFFEDHNTATPPATKSTAPMTAHVDEGP
jgi:uncharacterized protein